MTIHRRDFLKGSLGAAGAAAAAALLPAGAARAQSTPAKKLVLVLNYGGWDPTWSLDPKPGRPLIDVGAGSELRVGNIPIWSDPSRPSVDRFFQRWGAQSCVVNGVQVRSFVHTDCIKRILTGSPSETTPDLGAIAAFERAAELPVPYLALGPSARSGQLASITGRTGTSNQLVALVDPAAGYFPMEGQPMRPSTSEKARVQRFLEASAKRLQQTRGQRGYNAKRVKDFIDSLTRADQLAAFAADGGDFGARDYTLDMNVQIPIAARALDEGLSHAVMMQSGFNWDTHTNNEQQSAFQEGLFSQLDTLCDTFDQRGLLDDTVICVLSEMGRTPKLNGDLGKDHWPVTSAILIGAGVIGDRALGGTTDELGAESIDLATGEVTASGAQLQAANLVAGVLQHVGVDPEAYLPGVEVFDAFA